VLLAPALEVAGRCNPGVISDAPIETDVDEDDVLAAPVAIRGQQLAPLRCFHWTQPNGRRQRKVSGSDLTKQILDIAGVCVDVRYEEIVCNRRLRRSLQHPKQEGGLPAVIEPRAKGRSRKRPKEVATEGVSD